MEKLKVFHDPKYWLGVALFALLWSAFKYAFPESEPEFRGDPVRPVVNEDGTIRHVLVDPHFAPRPNIHWILDFPKEAKLMLSGQR